MKFGKRNEIKINPLKYNFMLIGDSGIGKSSLTKLYCEKLAGEEGYIFLEIGKEDGADAINGINYLNCPEWDLDYNEETNEIGFNTFVEDVVENRMTDWAELKVVVIDTYDELFTIAEQEVIDMHNREKPDKRVKSVKAAFGGYQAGEDKTIEIVLNNLWALKRVGVSFIVIGHTKNKNLTDAETGTEYMQLTSNMSQKYFNAIKNKVHFLGVASYAREIVTEKTGKKEFGTNKDATKNVLKSETRKITFRSDAHVIDSKSRFADIVDSIPFDVDELITAITDAIKAEYSKSGKSLDEGMKEQKEQERKREEKISEKEQEKKKENEIEKLIEKILGWFKDNKSDPDVYKPVLNKVKELGYTNPKEISSLEDAMIIFNFISEM